MKEIYYYGKSSIHFFEIKKTKNKIYDCLSDTITQNIKFNYEGILLFIYVIKINKFLNFI